VIAVDCPSARLSHRSTAAAAAGGFAAEVWRWPAVDIEVIRSFLATATLSSRKIGIFPFSTVN